MQSIQVFGYRKLHSTSRCLLWKRFRHVRTLIVWLCTCKIHDFPPFWSFLDEDWHYLSWIFSGSQRKFNISARISLSSWITLYLEDIIFNPHMFRFLCFTLFKSAVRHTSTPPTSKIFNRIHWIYSFVSSKLLSSKLPYYRHMRWNRKNPRIYLAWWHSWQTESWKKPEGSLCSLWRLWPRIAIERAHLSLCATKCCLSTDHDAIQQHLRMCVHAMPSTDASNAFTVERSHLKRDN